MKILFLIKGLQFIERTGLMYLSSVLKKGGHDTCLLETAKYPFFQLKERIRGFNPDFIAYSTMTGEHNYYLSLNNELKKEFSFFSVFGGPHPTFFPEMIEEKGVDFICIGEGEYALLELVNSIENGSEYNLIKNLWVKEKRNGCDYIHKNPCRKLIEDLDSLPFPDREIMYQCSEDLRNYESKVFFSGRGCPYSCSYCFNHKYNEMFKDKGKIVRIRSVKNLIGEIYSVKNNYPLKFVWFDDDNFILKSKQWLLSFKEEYKKRIGLPFVCNVRANLINEESVGILKEAGCYSVWMGIECGDEKISQELLKRELSNENIIKACRLLKSFKIKFASQNLMGLPVKNPLSTDFETLKLNFLCKPDFAWSSIWFPYPGTELGNYAIKFGYMNELKSLKEFPETNKSTSVLNFPLEEKKKIENFHKLFGIAVEFPFLIVVLRFLISLPFQPIYKFVYFSWYGFCFRIRLEKMDKNLKTLLKLVKSLFLYLKTVK